MEKRALLAVVLSLAFFYGYNLLFPQPEPKKVHGPVQKVVSSAQVAQKSALPVEPPPPTPQSVNLREVSVETDMYTAVFTNLGGSLKSLTLKKFRESSSPDSELVSLISAANQNGFAFNTESSGLGLSSESLFVPSADSVKVTGSEKKTLQFTWTSPQGVVVKKTYSFTGDGYAIALDTLVINQGANRAAGTLDTVLPYPDKPKEGLSRFEYNNAVTLEDGEFTSEPVKKLDDESLRYTTRVGWTGYSDKYFLTALLSEGNSIASVTIRKGKGSYLDTVIASPAFDVLPGASYNAEYRLFLGPKGLDVLKKQGHDLEKALDLGWFSAIAKPLLYVLEFFNTYTHNYGVAIIIITVIIKILFFPLTHKSYKAMKQMQKLQPQMAALKEKYKDDREGLSRSMMEMYRTHKVNPMSGCLPMLIQIPVFFALYKALMFSIELRHAPFIFWITDLSAKDPYYVTPIIMGVTMFIQQKMTPSTMDPMQAKIMLALPIVFTFMFLNFPSGLVIYWLVNNILTIAQQVYINRSLKDA